MAFNVGKKTKAKTRVKTRSQPATKSTYAGHVLHQVAQLCRMKPKQEPRCVKFLPSHLSMKRIRLKPMHTTEINFVALRAGKPFLPSSRHFCFGERWKEDGNYHTGLDPKVPHIYGMPRMPYIKYADAKRIDIYIYNNNNNNTENPPMLTQQCLHFIAFSR